MITLKLTDTGVAPLLAALAAAMGKPQPALKAIGEEMLEFTKERFAESKDPYGTPWAENSDTTLRKLLHSNKKNFTPVKGHVSARGKKVLANKKPLIGETKSLSTEFASTVDARSVTVRSTMIYAAMQQFGGKKDDFPHLWGDIPARPFFPDEQRGLPPDLANAIRDVLADTLAGLGR